MHTYTYKNTNAYIKNPNSLQKYLNSEMTIRQIFKGRLLSQFVPGLSF